MSQRTGDRQNPVTLEMFGMPRVLTGTDRLNVYGHTLGDVLQCAVSEHPELAEHVLSADGDWLNAGYTFVVDGTFTRDPERLVEADSEILLVSRASGG